MEFEEITKEIIGAAYAVYNEMGFGFLESIYESCLVLELTERGLIAESQKPIKVYFRGNVVGHFEADLLVNELVIVELKSVRQLIEAHEVQLVNYLVATKIPVGLLINFGPSGVEVKRKVRELKTASTKVLLNPARKKNPAVWLKADG
jgi:GxxExxY protein